MTTRQPIGFVHHSTSQPRGTPDRRRNAPGSSTLSATTTLLDRSLHPSSPVRGSRVVHVCMCLPHTATLESQACLRGRTPPPRRTLAGHRNAKRYVKHSVPNRKSRGSNTYLARQDLVAPGCEGMCHGSLPRQSPSSSPVLTTFATCRCSAPAAASCALSRFLTPTVRRRGTMAPSPN